MTSRERRGVSDPQQLEQLFSSLLLLTWKGTLKPRIAGPQNGPVIRKRYPCHAVFMTDTRSGWKQQISQGWCQYLKSMLNQYQHFATGTCIFENENFTFCLNSSEVWSWGCSWPLSALVQSIICRPTGAMHQLCPSLLAYVWINGPKKVTESLFANNESDWCVAQELASQKWFWNFVVSWQHF